MQKWLFSAITYQMLAGVVGDRVINNICHRQQQNNASSMRVAETHRAAIMSACVKSAFGEMAEAVLGSIMCMAYRIAQRCSTCVAF